MPITRKVQCDICNKEHLEINGAGFPDWMLVQGIELDGNPNVWLCPEHRNIVADYIDNLKQKHLNKS